MPSKCVDDFDQKCRKFFDEANGGTGDPITPAELVAVIRKALPEFEGDDQEIAQMFLDVDADSDQKITWEEFHDALLAKEPKEVTRAELEAKFKEIDADGSGKLNKQEVKNLVAEAELELSEERLDALMDAADPNGDGVDFKEFLAAWKNE